MKILVLFIACAAAFVACSRTPDGMVFVEGGAFQMGNTVGGGDDDELPVHEVTLDSYLIGACEVTVGEFREFVEAAGYMTTAERDSGASVFIGKKVEKRGDANWKNPYYEQDDRHPVVCVSWYDAVEYCNWRSGKEALEPCYRGNGDSVRCDFSANGYRLPTEAEWEFAARSRGRRIKFAWGDSMPYIDDRPAGNTRDEAANREWEIKNYWKGYDDGYARSSPVGSFAPNELGVYDISGNVYEWCWDWFDGRYYEYSPVDNPAGPPAGEMRSCRDAGFACAIRHEAVASRGLGIPSLTFSWGGFRLSRSYAR